MQVNVTGFLREFEAIECVHNPTDPEMQLPTLYLLAKFQLAAG